MSLQDTTSTAGILAELNNRLTSYESTIRELRSKNRDFVNRLRDSQQIRKDLCIKVNSLQNDLEKRDKELKIQKDQNKQLKKRVTNLSDLNSNYQNKIEELKMMCEQLRNTAKSNESNNGDDDHLKTSIIDNTNSHSNIPIERKQTKSLINNQSKSIDSDNITNQDETNKKKMEIEDSIKNNEHLTDLKSTQNSTKSLLVKEDDLKFSVEEINDENMRYIPVSDDPIDRAIATFTNSRKNKIFFTRVKQGTYVYGRLMVEAKLVTKPGVDKNKPLLRIVSRGKLYTLADFVNTHENEELNNIENSLKNQNNNNLLSPDGQTLVVASPINKFRTTNPPITHQNSQSVSTSRGINQYMQSPLPFSSDRIQIMDSKPSQGIQMQNYVVNYPTSIHDIMTSQKNNALISSTFYGNINGIQQLSPINKNNQFNIQQLSLLPTQQYPYYHMNETISHMGHQYKNGVNYQASTPTLIAPPPIAEYMPVTTPIIMTRQPINALNNNIGSTSPTSMKNIKDSKMTQNQIEISNFSHEKNIKETKKSFSSPSILTKSSKVPSKLTMENREQTDSNITGEPSVTSSLTPPASLNANGSKDNIGNIQTDEVKLTQQENFQNQKGLYQVPSSSIKSVSASTIGEWYRQASIIKRCNSYSCENFFASSNKK